MAVNPDKELARVAREEGWEIMRFERLGRKLRVAAAATAVSAAAAYKVATPMSLHELTDDQRRSASSRKRFADEQIAPHAAQWDRDHHFPRELFAELGELGLMGVCVPEEHGGAGADFLAYMLVLEELSRGRRGRRRDRRRAHQRGHAADPQPRLRGADRAARPAAGAPARSSRRSR